MADFLSWTGKRHTQKKKKKTLLRQPRSMDFIDIPDGGCCCFVFINAPSAVLLDSGLGQQSIVVGSIPTYLHNATHMVPGIPEAGCCEGQSQPQTSQNMTKYGGLVHF